MPTLPANNIGVISDTHGLLRPEAMGFLKTCDVILHAGDIGHPDILETLASVAPTYAVRGNMDWEPWAAPLPHQDYLEIGGKFFCLIHNIDELDLDPAGARLDAVVFGHSHLPTRVQKDGVLYFNPGSAGRRRFNSPATIGKIIIADSRLDSEFITLSKG